jgi:hypothetical protein
VIANDFVKMANSISLRTLLKVWLFDCQLWRFGTDEGIAPFFNISQDSSYLSYIWEVDSLIQTQNKVESQGKNKENADEEDRARVLKTTFFYLLRFIIRMPLRKCPGNPCRICLLNMVFPF